VQTYKSSYQKRKTNTVQSSMQFSCSNSVLASSHSAHRREHLPKDKQYAFPRCYKVQAS